jgi:DUF2934 family protein
MAKRQVRRNPQTSDPDSGGMTDSGVHGDELLDTSAPQQTAQVADRSSRMNAGDAPSNPSGEISYDDIAALAYDLWARRGHGHGSDFEDWVEAERQLREARRRR